LSLMDNDILDFYDRRLILCAGPVNEIFPLSSSLWASSVL